MQIATTKIQSTFLAGLAVLLVSAAAFLVLKQPEDKLQAKPEFGRLADVFPPSEDYQFNPPEPGTYKLNSIKKAPDGRVLDIKGDTRSLSDLTNGKITLVSFVYLTCGDTNGCPFAMSTLFNLHEASIKLPHLRDDLQLMTISFDPERDTPEAIASFAYPVTIDPQADRKLQWHVLTTENQKTLKPIIDGYGQVIDRSDDLERINHLLRMYLVDREGNIRNVYGLGLIDPRLLITDVETLLMEEAAS